MTYTCREFLGKDDLVSFTVVVEGVEAPAPHEATDLVVLMPLRLVFGEGRRPGRNSPLSCVTPSRSSSTYSRPT